jgi:uncharacterized protein (TIGR02246 family)
MDDVWATVHALNQAWASDGHPERLGDYFAPEMIAVTPEPGRLVGREACVAAWTGFVRATTIRRWIEKNVLVQMIGDGCAIVAYDFEIDFEIGGRLVEMKGRDLMTLVKRDRRWWLVADHYSPSPG